MNILIGHDTLYASELARAAAAGKIYSIRDYNFNKTECCIYAQLYTIVM